MFPVQAGSVARAIDSRSVQQEAPSHPAPSIQLVTEALVSDTEMRVPVQAPLFGPQAVQPKPQPARRASRGPNKPARNYEAQRSLNLEGTQDGARTLPTSVEAAVWCNAPVAVAPHRIMACISGYSAVPDGLRRFYGGAVFRRSGVPRRQDCPRDLRRGFRGSVSALPVGVLLCGSRLIRPAILAAEAVELRRSGAYKKAAVHTYRRRRRESDFRWHGLVLDSSRRRTLVMARPHFANFSHPSRLTFDNYYLIIVIV